MGCKAYESHVSCIPKKFLKQIKGRIAKKKVKLKKEKKQRQAYLYSNLGELVKKAIGYRTYTYSVVLDISYPIQNKDTLTYSCNAKLIDNTINSQEIVKYITAVFVSKEKEEIPQPTKIGNIIRIHRGELQFYKDQLILNCRVGICSWVLFDNTKGLSIALAYSGKHYSWAEADCNRLLTIRAFAKEHFNKNEIHFTLLKDAANNKPEDFDSLCMILKRKEKNGKIILKACDKETIVKIITDDDRPYYASAEDIVKLRSGYYERSNEAKIIILKEHSNILIVPNEYLSAKMLRDFILNKKVPKNIKCLLPLYIPLLNKQRVISKVINECLFKEVTLRDLNTEAAIPCQKYFMLSVNFIEIIPQNPQEWLYILDEKTNEAQKPEAFFSNCNLSSLPLGKKYFFKFQAFAKDSSISNDDSMFTLNLCTVTGKGSEFIDIGLNREQPNKIHYKCLKRICKAIKKAWNVLKLGIEAIDIGMNERIYFITGSKLKLKFI